MEPRKKKQIFIGSVFFLIVLATAFAIDFFYFRTVPTCADGIKNQKEEGIDCGGPCANSCETAVLKDISIQWVKALSTKDQNYDLAARVSNPNQNHGSRKVEYEFKLYDLNGAQIGVKSGSTFIQPRQDKYIIELKAFVKSPVARVQLDLKPVAWEKVADYTEPEISVFNKNYQLLSGGPPFSQASCILKNDSHDDFKGMKLNFILFNPDGAPLAVNSSEIGGLAAGQERFFSIPWHFEINGNVAKIEVEPDVDIFE